jgi:hypothetical protein
LALFSIDNFSLDLLFADVITIEKYYEISVGMCAVKLKKFLRKKRFDGTRCAISYLRKIFIEIVQGLSGDSIIGDTSVTASDVLWYQLAPHET